jgi:nucleoid DNA-binding protein
VNIIPVIRDLLLRNQKAVIPGLGSFVIAQRPAQLNKVTRVLTPPSPTIRFDKNQQADDSLLLGYLNQKLKQKKEVALGAIEKFAIDINKRLKEEEKVNLEGLGTLSSTKSGDIAFTPEEELLKRISLFELPNLNIPAPVEKVRPEPPPPPPIVKRDIPVPIKRKKRWWIPAAVILFLLGIFLAAVYFTGNFDTLMADIHSYVTGEKNPNDEKLIFGTPARTEKEITTDTLTDDISRQLDEKHDRSNALSYVESKVKPEEKNVPPQVNKPAVFVSSGGYHIIAGAFHEAGNAEKQKSALEKKGFSPMILPKHGDYYMVSLGSFANREQANAALKDLSSKLEKELWVLKK